MPVNAPLMATTPRVRWCVPISELRCSARRQLALLVRLERVEPLLEACDPALTPRYFVGVRTAFGEVDSEVLDRLLPVADQRAGQTPPVARLRRRFVQRDGVIAGCLHLARISPEAAVPTRRAPHLRRRGSRALGLLQQRQGLLGSPRLES